MESNVTTTDITILSPFCLVMVTRFCLLLTLAYTGNCWIVGYAETDERKGLVEAGEY